MRLTEDSASATPPSFLAICARLGSRLIALMVLIVYCPALLILSTLVLLTSPGPAFVRRAYRRGRGEGEVVYLYEFRTECWRTLRQTPLGAFLRTMDLHRLPRLANVLSGEVSAGERLLTVTA